MTPAARDVSRAEAADLPLGDVIPALLARGHASPMTVDLDRLPSPTIARMLAGLHDQTQSLSLLLNLRPGTGAQAATWRNLRRLDRLRYLSISSTTPMQADQLAALLQALPIGLTHLRLAHVQKGIGGAEPATPCTVLQDAVRSAGLPAHLRELWLCHNQLNCYDYLAVAERVPPNLVRLGLGLGNPDLNAAALACSRRPLPEVAKDFDSWHAWFSPRAPLEPAN